MSLYELHVFYSLEWESIVNIDSRAWEEVFVAETKEIVITRQV
jgi:hypothetical protein